ncbi:MAG: efflux RND transporter permease subunit, partial [Muribaculaceae bacterium]|nr:efflux RND transporter permease subunit [Muribaculaceae bacterium]
EVRMPIFNSSLIIVASFLPLFFLSGMEGRLLRPLGVAFIVALGASTIVALTLTPVLCSYLIGSKKSIRQSAREPRPARFLKERYSAALQRCMRHPVVMTSATGVLLVLAVAILLFTGRGFLPGFNEGSMTINVTTLPGISLEESDRIGRRAEQIILETPEVETVARKTGRAELDEHSLGVNMSEIEAPYRLDGRSRQEMEDDLRQRLSLIPGANIEIGQPVTHRINAMLSGSEAPVAVKVFGSDLSRMQAIGEQIGRLMHGISGFTDINVERPSGRPRITITPRRNIMARYGITMKQFSDAVSVALAGKTVSQVYDSSMPYDVTLKYDTDARSTIASLAELPIDSNAGKIPLSAVAEIKSTSGPDTVNRENVKRRLTVAAAVTGRDMGGAVNELREAVAKEIELPEGYAVEYGGQFESAASATATLLLATLLSLVVIFMLLYGEYRNLGQALLLLVNMPLAMIGGAIILPLTDSHLNIPAIIGFISLLGISTRNGMLLLSRYNSLRAEGHDIDSRIRIG